MRKQFKESEIINLLRVIEVKISGGMGTEEACRSVGVSDKSYYRWHKLYGSMGRLEIRRCKNLEEENQRLRRIVSDLELDKSILKEALNHLGHRVQARSRYGIRSSIYASVWAVVNAAPLRYRTSPAVPNAMHPDERIINEDALRLVLIRLTK